MHIVPPVESLRRAIKLNRQTRKFKHLFLCLIKLYTSNTVPRKRVPAVLYIGHSVNEVVGKLIRPCRSLMKHFISLDFY